MKTTRNFDEIDVRKARVQEEDLLTKIGEKLKKLREDAGLTLLDVAFYTYVNMSTLHRLEKGKLSNITTLSLIKICLFFEIDLKDLLN